MQQISEHLFLGSPLGGCLWNLQRMQYQTSNMAAADTEKYKNTCRKNKYIKGKRYTDIKDIIWEML